MKLEADALITFPRDVVYSTYRDRLPELVPFLPNVKKITVQKRDDQAHISKLTNLWEAKGDIPKVAQAVIKPEMLAWLDHATWDQNAWTVDWRIETKMFTESIKCFGHNTYEVVDDGNSILKIRGELSVDLKGIPGVPRLLASTVAPHVEKFVIALLTPNLVSVAKGLEAFLNSEKK